MTQRVVLPLRGGNVWLHVAIVLGLAVVLLLVPTFGSLNVQRLAFFILWYAIMASAWNLIGGYAGQTSFGHGAFVGMGAYVSGILWSSQKIDPLLTLPIAGLIAAVYSLLVGAPTLRLRGPYFAIATIGVGEASRLLAVNIDDIFGITLTHGVTGISLPAYDADKVHYATVAVFVALMLTTVAIREGRFGLGLFAVNMDRDAAETLGVPTARVQVIALAISAFFCATAGTLYAARQQFLDPATMFSFDRSIQMVLMSVVGGIGTIWGPVFGAVVFGLVLDQLQSSIQSLIRESWVPYLPQLVYGVLLVIIVLYEPLGVAGVVARAGRLLRKLALPRDGTEARAA